MPSPRPRPPLLPGHRRNYLTTHAAGARLLSASQLPWFTFRPPSGYGVLTTFGRKTGKPRRRCVRAIRVADTVYVVAIGGPHASWLRNLRAHPQVQLRIRGGLFDGVARPVTERERDGVRVAYRERFHPFELAEYVMHMRLRPTRARIAALHDHWFTTGTPVAIDLVGRLGSTRAARKQ